MSLATKSNETANFACHPAPVVAQVSTERGVYSGTLCMEPVLAVDSVDCASRKISNATNNAVDPSNPAVRRVVYNLYRGLLGTYNDKANDIISNLPAERVREDQGIDKQIEEMIRQSSQINGKNVSGSAPRISDEKSKMAQPITSTDAPCYRGMGAPPPPPMPNTGSVPSVKINSELGACLPGKGGKHLPGGGVPFSYAPPSAIQNTMMTKDKKPFTYTPGGIDLSEIRSPRMQRRISKNAADEGVIPVQQYAAAPISPLAAKSAAIYPQIAVPVFPQHPAPNPSQILHPTLHPMSLSMVQPASPSEIYSVPPPSPMCNPPTPVAYPEEWPAVDDALPPPPPDADENVASEEIQSEESNVAPTTPNYPAPPPFACVDNFPAPPPMPSNCPAPPPMPSDCPAPPPMPAAPAPKRIVPTNQAPTSLAAFMKSSLSQNPQQLLQKNSHNQQQKQLQQEIQLQKQRDAQQHEMQLQRQLQYQQELQRERQLQQQQQQEMQRQREMQQQQQQQEMQRQREMQQQQQLQEVQRQREMQQQLHKEVNRPRESHQPTDLQLQRQLQYQQELQREREFQQQQQEMQRQRELQQQEMHRQRELQQQQESALQRQLQYQQEVQRQRELLQQQEAQRQREMQQQQELQRQQEMLQQEMQLQRQLQEIQQQRELQQQQEMQRQRELQLQEWQRQQEMQQAKQAAYEIQATAAQPAGVEMLHEGARSRSDSNASSAGSSRSPANNSPLLIKKQQASVDSDSRSSPAAAAAAAPIVERRNVQIGSIYIPPVTQSNGQSGSSAISGQPKSVPSWMNSRNQATPSPPFIQTYADEAKQQTGGVNQIRVIPIAVEGRGEPLQAARTQSPSPISVPWQNSSAKIIPIHLEMSIPARCESRSNTPQYTQQQPTYQQQQPQQQQQAPWRTQSSNNPTSNQMASLMEELNMATNDPSVAASRTPQQPTQSRSFRILQLITDTIDEGGPMQEYEPVESGRLSRSSVGSSGSGGAPSRAAQGPAPERRLVLTQDDRDLMDMFRSQVSEENSLHQEVDPRYRGSHIPSRAFRILQNYTDSPADGPQQGVRPQATVYQSVQNSNGSARPSTSEQCEAEPRKYMGGSIPSRSFRMLQAMTATDPNDGKSDL